MINRPISRPASALEGMPWYDVTPWEEDELSRIFDLRARERKEVLMPGLSFHQYNLSALTKRFEEIEENNENQRLVRWLNLFARHKLRQLKELKHLEKEEPVLWKAYELLTHLPKEVEESSQEVEKMYEFNDVQKGLFKQIGLEEGIQRGIEKGIEKGKLEGKLESSKEVAIRLLEMGLDLSVIQKATQLSLNQIESLKNDQK